MFMTIQRANPLINSNKGRGEQVIGKGIAETEVTHGVCLKKLIAHYFFCSYV